MRRDIARDTPQLLKIPSFWRNLVSLARNHLSDSYRPFPLIGSGLGSSAAWYGGFPCALSPAGRLMHPRSTLIALLFRLDWRNRARRVAEIVCQRSPSVADAARPRSMRLQYPLSRSESDRSVSMLTETGPRTCVEKGPLRRGLEGLSNDIRNWSELGPLRHEELAPLLS
jgi:hypothetical protein